jgi:hypothetical protein
MATDPDRILSNDEIREKIALRAYEIYQDRGGQHGRDIDDWLQAENDMLAEAEEKKALYGRKKTAQTESAESPQRAPSTRRRKPASG